jgi:hypothetical protein
MTAADYLAHADRFARAANAARDPVARSQLEALASSYSVLAKSTAVLDRAGKTLRALEQQRRSG